MSQPPPPAPSPGDLHDDQVVALLRTDSHAALLSAYFGEREYHELCQLAKLAARHDVEHGPVVYILPGIMGSKLAAPVDDAMNVLWLHPGAIAAGAMLDLALPRALPLQPVGVMLPGYLKLKLKLAIAGFKPIFYAFDWRQDLLELGASLIRHIEQNHDQPVCIVAHSMGGLVARAALAHPQQAVIRQLIQLGAPNAGSFAPVQALRAVYPTVRKIAALDPLHSAEQLAQRVFRTLPGLYQLLPSHERYPERDFFDARAWPQDEFKPDEKILQQARSTRAALAAADARCSIIVGVNQATVSAVHACASGLEYIIRHEGDGTVPYQLALWPGAGTWYVEETHGALANSEIVLNAVVDLLRKGGTARLSTNFDMQPAGAVLRVTDMQLRREATRKVRWDSLSIDSRRRILDPVISPEFRDP